MNYIWNENYPIAIHVTEGEYTPEQLQYIANTDQLVVRDLRNNYLDRDYHPNEADKHAQGEHRFAPKPKRWPNGDIRKNGES